MEDILAEYREFYAFFDYSLVDESAIKRHIDNISSFAEISKSAIAIHDIFSLKTVYTSQNYRDYFGEDDYEAIHPDDYNSVIWSSLVALKYFQKTNKNIIDYKLVRKYRAKIKGNYCVIVEQVQALEFDKNGNVWLSLAMVEISPTQSPPYNFEFKIYNYKTAEIISPDENYFALTKILSERELEILRLIDKGFLSKEISQKLSITENTVNTHRQNILKKLKVGTSIEAINFARNLGIL